ncbi:MAG TPA: M20/M25/M40 family metallo-hydrolase [Sphingomicrobium sp.]|nr:M20/M25/M40 family metallo-hydrolase [Sphingomicrobium sp.]
MRRPIVLLALLVVALLGAMAAKSWLIELPPVRANNTAAQFSAERAASRLAFVLGDQRPHPADTPANDMVRGKIVSLLQSMGLQPIVRDQIACNELYKASGVSCARVRNVIAVIGPSTGKAVLLNAHYDSVPMGPGAGDDGIGVATLLDVASILRNQPPKRPVILLFNEGEELGLVGARAFLADPLSRNVDSLINLEARGVRGPANMFETNHPDAAPIATYANAVDRPVANSLGTDVYRLLPNYTDVNSFSERQWLTLNIAPIGNETRYHSAGDELAALDHRTLQHMGDQTLALAQALANGPPPSASGERLFVDLAGQTLISLPMMVGVVLLVGLILAFAWLSWRRGGMVAGAAVAVGTIVGSAALSWLALAVIGAVRHGIFWRAEPHWTHLAVYASVILAAVTLLATIGRRRDPRQLTALFWLVYMLLGGVIALIAPGGIIFFIFPPLAALIGIVAARWWKPAELAGAIVALVLLYLTWGEMLALLEELLNQGPMWVFAILGSLVILPLLIFAKPLIDKVSMRAAVGLCGVFALLGWGIAVAAPATSADRQQRYVIEHATDVTSGKAHWSVVNDGSPLPEAYASIGKWTRGKLPFSDRLRWLTTAPGVAGLTAPTVELVASTPVPKGRIVTFRIHSNGAERLALIAAKNAQIRSAGVADFDRPIDPKAEGKYHLACSGRGCDGLTMQFTTAQPRLELTLVGSRSGLPQSAQPVIAGRPKFARPQYLPDETLTVSKIRL